MVDILQSMIDEQYEAAEILRAAFPKMSEGTAWENAKVLRTSRYEIGRYLTAEELKAHPYFQGCQPSSSR